MSTPTLPPVVEPPSPSTSSTSSAPSPRPPLPLPPPSSSASTLAELQQAQLSPSRVLKMSSPTLSPSSSAAAVAASSPSRSTLGVDSSKLVYGGDWLDVSVAGLYMTPPEEEEPVCLRAGEESEGPLVSLSLSRVPPSDSGSATACTDSGPLRDGDVVTVSIGGGSVGWVCTVQEVGQEVKWVRPSLEPGGEGGEGAILTPFVVEVIGGAQDGELGLGCVIRLGLESGCYLGLSPSSPSSSPGRQGLSTLVVVSGDGSAAPIAISSVLFSVRSPTRPPGSDAGGESSVGDSTPRPASSPSTLGPEEEVFFGEGELGITIKRTPTGRACVIKIIPETQAEHNGIKSGDFIMEVNDMDLRKEVLDSRSWQRLIDYLRTGPRPLRVVVVHAAKKETSSPVEDPQEVMARLEAQLEMPKPSRGGAPRKIADGNRVLLYQGRLRLWQEGRIWHSMTSRHIFLLSDLVLVAQPPNPPKNPKYEVEEVVNLPTCKLRGVGRCNQLDPKSKEVYSFDLVTPVGVLTLCASTESERRNWVHLLYRAILDALQIAPTLHNQVGVEHQVILGTLHSAVIHAHVEEVCDHLDVHGEDPNQVDSYKRTPLHYATAARQHELMSLLLHHGAVISMRDAKSLTPVHLSALALDDTALTLLLSKTAAPARVNERDDEGQTPAFLAAIKGRLPSGERDPIAIRRCLLSLQAYGADVDALDNHGRSALHVASSRLESNVVEVLLDLGADPNLPCVDDDGHLALHLCCMDCPDDAEPHTMVTTLEVLLQRGAQPNLGDAHGRTALHYMIDNEKMLPATKAAAVSVLVSYGGRTDVADEQGITCATMINDTSPKKTSSSAGSGGSNQLEACVSSGLSVWKGKGSVSVPEDFESRLLDKSLWSNGDGNGDDASKRCSLCTDAFSFTKRQHHCRYCGRLVCGNCSSKKLLLPSTDKIKLSNTDSVRLCDGCFNKIKTETFQSNLKRQNSASQSGIASQQAKFERDKAELLGQEAPPLDSSTSGSLSGPRRLAERARSWLTGEEKEKEEPTNKASAMTRKARLLGGEMDQLRDGLNQRGEKLASLADKTSELADSSAQFAALAKALNEQQSNRFSFW